MKPNNPISALFSPIFKLSLFLVTGWVLIYIIMLNTRSQTSQKVLSATHLLLTRDETGASADFQQYLTQHSDDVNAYIQVGTIYLNNNHPHSTAKIAEMALHDIGSMSRSQRARLYILLSLAYHKEGGEMQKPALAAAHEALGFEPKNPDALNCLGYLMISTSKSAEGISIGLNYIEKAISENQQNIELRSDPTENAALNDSYGWGLYNLSLYSAQPQALQSLNHAQSVLKIASDEIPPKSPPELIKTINYHLAVTCYKTGHLNEALTALNTALLYDPASRELLTLKSEINQTVSPVKMLTVSTQKSRSPFSPLNRITVDTSSAVQDP